MKEIKQEAMVGWFNPGQLWETGLQTLFSTIIGKYSDRRLIQALASRRNEFYDYTVHYVETPEGLKMNRDHPRNEIWIDYVADIGDGWNSTYAVAYNLSQPELHLTGKTSAQSYETKQGSVLIFGGDEVYPAASRQNYRKRLIYPYQVAFGSDNPREHPHVFAIPGNHDWYDSLQSFTRLFCSDLGQRKLAGWLTRQKRSYFALKLPGGWWLLGSDGQLQSDIDTPQIEYFRYVAEKHMMEGDRVILCIAEPVWIQASKYRFYGAPYDESDLLYLQHEILSKKNIEVKVFLAGDLHHYRRHEEKDPVDPEAKTQKITSGGGGASLHPTHGADVSIITEVTDAPDVEPRKFILKKSFPEIHESRALCWRNLAFLWNNPWFGILPGILYLMTAWIAATTIGNKNPDRFWKALFYTVSAFGENPGLALWMFLIVGMFILCTDTHSRFYKWAGGITHCLAHFFCIFYLSWGIAFLCNRYLPHEPLLQFLVGGGAIFGLGWIVGSQVMGLYLLISLNVFGRHDKEAFTALRIEDFKNFLRMHVAADGTLTIYPIKIEKVPRKWRKRRKTEEARIKSLLVPVGGSRAELVEDPIQIRASQD